jgi:8-oxo-dGTP diphosphatase
MDMSNPLYRNQCIYVNIVAFTVEDRKVKVLLVQRKVEPFVEMWIVPGGVVYNNESTDTAAVRELKEKTGLEGVHLQQFYAFNEPFRDPRMRMLSVAYLALIDKNKVEVLQETPKTLDAGWYDINNVPELGFDHNDMLKKAIQRLRQIVTSTNLVKDLLPDNFTLPELQKIYETIIGKEMDRRNFRRKFLNLGLIKKTGKQQVVSGHRPADYYKFVNDRYKEIEIF